MPRYQIFPVRLRPDDKQVLADLVKCFGLSAMSDAIRVSSRVIKMLELTPEKVQRLNKKFEAEHPEALKIVFPIPD